MNLVLFLLMRAYRWPNHGQSVSLEYILEQNPDYIFVIDRAAGYRGGSISSKADVRK